MPEPRWSSTPEQASVNSSFYWLATSFPFSLCSTKNSKAGTGDRTSQESRYLVKFTFVALSIFVFVRFASDLGGMLKEAFSAPASLVPLWRREETNVRSPSNLLKKLMTRCDNKNKVGQQGQRMTCLKKGDKDDQTLMTCGWTAMITQQDDIVVTHLHYSATWPKWVCCHAL